MPHEADSLLSSLLGLAQKSEFRSLELVIGGQTISVRIATVASPVATTAALSPLERKILGAVVTEDWTPGERIANAVGERYGEGLKYLLSNLAERGLLESAPGRGYRLHPGTSQ